MRSRRPLRVLLIVLLCVPMALVLVFAVFYAIRDAAWRLSPTAPVGVTLIYEVDPEFARDLAPVDMQELLVAVDRRVNPGRAKHARVRLLADGRIEIGVFGSDPEVVHRIQRRVEAPGTFEFRILANNRDHQDYFEPARAEPPGGRLYDSDGQLLAWWVPVAQGQEESFMYHIFLGPREGAPSPTYEYDEENRKGVFRGVQRPEKDREICIRKQTDERGHEYLEVLVVNDQYNVNGSYLVRAAPGVDESGRPCVRFTFNQQGGRRFGALTATNQPQEGQETFTRKLGIILDGKLQSGPAIQAVIYQEGRITGRFTEEDVEELVDILNAGSLPGPLRKVEQREADGKP